jgi:hypothetical protein
MLAVASVPQFTQPLNLMRVFCVFLALGKLGYGEVFSSFVEKVTGIVFPVIYNAIDRLLINELLQ